MERLDAVSLVCDAHLTDFQNGFNHTVGADLIEILATIMPQFNETFKTCKWRNVADDCDKLFYKYLTDDGICYSFNSLSAAEVYNEERCQN